MNLDNLRIHIDKLPPLQTKKSLVAIDYEGFQMERHRLHRPTGEFACCTFTIKKPKKYHTYLLTKPYMVARALKNVSECTWVIQNASFDIQQLRRWADIEPRKKLWDTLVIERLLWAGYYNRFSLDDMVRRYCDIQADKSIRKTFEKSTELTQEQIHYAAMDGVYTLMVQEHQEKFVKKNRKDVKNVWENIDGPVLWAFLDFQGFRLDVDKWKKLAELATEKEQALDDFGINPRSPKQVVAHLREHGFKSLPNSQAGTLEKYIEKYPNCSAKNIAEKLLEYRSYKRLASTYGMNFIEKYLEEEEDYQVIHTNYDVNKAETGRTSSRDPNLQNIPIRKAPEYRRPWIARPGNKLVILDWSAQEARIHAYLTQDPVLLDIFKRDADVYTEAYNLMYEADISKSDPKRSDIGKPAFLGATYGQTPKGIAERYGMSEQDAEDMQERFFGVFRDSSSWCDYQSGKKNYTVTTYGRRTWLNPYSNQCGRNALNNPHQGTAADMMKLSIAKLHGDWHWDIPFGPVAQIHDELILDVPEELAPEIAEFTSNIMVVVGNALTPGVKHRADAVICDNWLEGK